MIKAVHTLTFSLSLSLSHFSLELAFPPLSCELHLSFLDDQFPPLFPPFSGLFDLRWRLQRDRLNRLLRNSCSSRTSETHRGGGWLISRECSSGTQIVEALRGRSTLLLGKINRADCFAQLLGIHSRNRFVIVLIPDYS